jgi:glutaconate CoA-transferase subunit A
MGVPFLPTLSAQGSDVARDNEFFAEIESPFGEENARSLDSEASLGMTSTKGKASTRQKLHAVKALHPDVTIVHVQRADAEGNAHCWGNFGIMLEAAKAAKRVIVTAEEIVAPEVIASDPNRTVIPGFLVSAVVEAPMGAHPSPVQGYYKRDDAYFRQYHERTKTKTDFDAWARRWVYGVADRGGYVDLLGECRVKELGVKRHAYAAAADFGY